MWAWVMGSPETHWLSLEYSSWGARLWQFGEDQKKQTTCLLLKIGRMVLAWCWLWLVLPHHGETQAQGDLWNWHGAKKGRRLPFDAPRRPTTARSTSAAARQDDSNQMRLAQKPRQKLHIWIFNHSVFGWVPFSNHAMAAATAPHTFVSNSTVLKIWSLSPSLGQDGELRRPIGVHFRQQSLYKIPCDPTMIINQSWIR